MITAPRNALELRTATVTDWPRPDDVSPSAPCDQSRVTGTAYLPWVYGRGQKGIVMISRGVTALAFGTRSLFAVWIVYAALSTSCSGGTHSETASVSTGQTPASPAPAGNPSGAAGVVATGNAGVGNAIPGVTSAGMGGVAASSAG